MLVWEPKRIDKMAYADLQKNISAEDVVQR